ncbi:MAG: hypothetical protein ABEJ31_12235 [Haloarculaceae archaeon]
MTDSADATRFGALFTAVTGESTITEPQRAAAPVEYADERADAGLAASVHAATTHEALADAIDHDVDP